MPPFVGHMAAAHVARSDRPTARPPTRPAFVGPAVPEDPELAERQERATVPAPPDHVERIEHAHRGKRSGAFEVDATRRIKPDPRREEE